MRICSRLWSISALFRSSSANSASSLWISCIFTWASTFSCLFFSRSFLSLFNFFTRSRASSSYSGVGISTESRGLTRIEGDISISFPPKLKKFFFSPPKWLLGLSDSCWGTFSFCMVTFLTSLAFSRFLYSGF